MCTVKCARLPVDNNLLNRKEKLTPGKEYAVETITWAKFHFPYYQYWFKLVGNDRLYAASLFKMTAEVNNLIAYCHTPLLSPIRLN